MMVVLNGRGSMIRKFAMLLAASGAMLAAPALAAPLKSPADVQVALRLMMQVTNDFDRQITRKTFARLPHENEEFKEATGALRTAIAGEPAGFKAKVTPAIDRAAATAQGTADKSGGADEAVLRAGQRNLVTAVNRVFAFFPATLRPDPNVQPGGRR